MKGGQHLAGSMQGKMTEKNQYIRNGAPRLGRPFFS